MNPALPKKIIIHKAKKNSLKNLIFIPGIIVLGLLQAAILDYINIFKGRPDFLLSSVIVASLFFGFRWAIFLSAFAGSLKDILSPNLFGINTLMFPLWSFLIIRLSKEIPMDSNFIRAVCIFIIVAINDVIAFLISLFLGNLIYWGVFLRTLFIDSLYTALVLPLVFRVIKPVLSPARTRIIQT